jgi:hypothetical protein
LLEDGVQGFPELGMPFWTGPSTPSDFAFYLTEGESGGPSGDCLPNVCDFEILGITFDGKDVTEGKIFNSLPKTLDVHIINWGEIPIYEVKLLADIYEKVCGNTTRWCWPIDKDHYNPKFDDNNDNFTVYDDPADDADDLGDTFTLWDEDSHSGGLCYRSTHGHELYSGAADKYIGRSELIMDDALIWAPANMSRRDLRDKACAKFEFWHKTKGEYLTDEDGNVVPIDYGHIAYSLDDGATWVEIPLGDFVAYDNGWEKWTIYFINLDANDGNYDTVCGHQCCEDGPCVPDCDDDNKIIVEDIFGPNAFLQVKFMWHVDPCNEYEGWFIDDICLDITEEYKLKLVHQTHEITDLPGCDPQVGPEVIDLDFPLKWDGAEDCHWYKIVIYGQVYSPQNCEYDLENNQMSAQIKISDIHDIACVAVDMPYDHFMQDEEDLKCGHIKLRKKTQCPEPDDETGIYDFTFKNVGTFPETNIPVELRVARKIVTYELEETFETDPSGRWNTYYFTGYNPTDLWRWTQGDPGIPRYRSAEDQPVGMESMICADVDLRPELKQCIGNLLTNDEVYLGCDKDVCCEEWELSFAAKWAMPAGSMVDPYGYYETWYNGGDVACMLIHPTEGPDSAYWWIINLGWTPGTYSADWVYYTITRENILGWFGYYEECGGCDPELMCPPFEFGWAVFTNSDSVKANHDATDVFGNPFPWGGLMIDDVKIESHNCDGNGDVVYTATLAKEDPCDGDNLNLDPHEILEPGEEETVRLFWNDTEYCNWCVIGDVNLPNDINPDNDTCCVQTMVISDCSCLADEEDAYGDDLTGGEESLWGLCTSDEGDDTFLTCTYDFGGYRYYTPNLDDMYATPDVDLSDYAALGAFVEFDTYFKFFSWCDPNYGTRYDDGQWGYYGPCEDPIWLKDDEAGDFGEVYVRTLVDDGCCPGVDEDDLYSEWIRLSSGTVGDRLWWDDYYIADDHDLCDDGLPRDFDWQVVQFGIPAMYCQERTQIGFRMVSNDLNTDLIPYCDGPDESEGWYIDDLKIGGTVQDIILEEGFENKGIPGTWTEVQYGGHPGHWKAWSYSSAASYKPPGTGSYYAGADSDEDMYDTFDTELFTPALDCTGSTNVVLDLQHSFEDFAGCGVAWIATYSGGINYPADLEEVLLFMDYDGDDGQLYGGCQYVTSFDPSGYSDPANVHIGFWYSTSGGTYCWGYKIDDVIVSQAVPGPVAYEDDFEGTFGGTTSIGVYPGGTEAGDFWEYTSPDPLWGCNFDGDGWFVHGFPSYGRGLNDALVMEIQLKPDEWSDAIIHLGHHALLPYGTACYIEISTDGTTWTTMWMQEVYDTWMQGVPVAYIFCDMLKDIYCTEFLAQGLDKIWVRCRFTTLGDELFDADPFGGAPEIGWFIDSIEIQCKITTPVDETAPVTQLVFDEASGQFSLFANDPGMHASGVAATYYQLDGGATTQYNNPVQLSDGRHTVTYWSVDNAGNEESHKNSPELVVDTNPPTIAITAPEDGGFYLFGSKLFNLGKTFCIGKITIKADAADTGTGVQMVTFDIDGDTGYAGAPPYEYTYRGVHFGAATATATAYDFKGNTAQDSVDFTIFSLGLL